MRTLPTGLQLYTVRDAAAKDFAGTLRAVAAMGYQAVEFAGYGGMEAAALKALLDDLHLRVAGAHVGLEVLEKDLQSVIEFNQAIGNPYVVCPYLPADRRTDAAAYGRVADALNAAGSDLKTAGLQLAYHNHDFEFARVESGEYALDYLLRATEPDLVQIELDTYWVKKAGEDPAAFLRKYPGRTPLIHLKDMTAGDQPTFAPVGTGVMDFAPIFEAAETAGAKFYLVEQDVCQGDPVESARTSLDNLRQMGRVEGQ